MVGSIVGIKNYIVQFELPYHLQVEDSFESNEEFRFYPVIDDILAELRFRSVQNDSMGVGIAGTAEGDRHGNLGHSVVQVWFDDSFIESIPNEVDNDKPINDDPVFHMGQPDGVDDYLIENAMDYLNKFLGVYRSRTGFYWITTMSAHEATRFGIVERYEDGEEKHRTRFVTEGPVKFGSIRDEVLNQVRRGVQMDSPVSLYNELDFDAMDKIDRGEFNSSVIDSATLFEAWIKNAYQRIAVEQGKSKKQARQDITKGGGSDEFLSPKNIADDHVPKLGFMFSDTDEFDNWDTDTREVRNKVIHEAYQATEAEAVDAKKAATNAMVRLSNEFKSELEGTPFFVQESPNHD